MELFDGPLLSEASKVYVGNLDYKISTDELMGIMSKAGRVLECQIPRDNKGRSRGYGLVKFESEAVSATALKLLNSLEINGRKLLVREDRAPVKSRRKTSKGSVGSKDVKEESDGSKNLFRPKKGFRRGSKNGKGSSGSPVSDTSNNVISFESKKNQGQPRQSIIRPKIKLDEESAGCLVYYGNIPWFAGKGEVLEYVGGADCQIPTDKRGRSKGYALVRYGSMDEANSCIDKFNELEWKGRKLIVRLFVFKHDNEESLRSP